AYHANTMRRRLRGHRSALAEPAEVAGPTQGKVILFATCYGNYNDPRIGEDLVAVFEHNGIAVSIVERERCCGMPKLELGDFESVEAAKQTNIPKLARWVDDGWDIVAPIPSCVLMFKQELPLMYPDDVAVQRVRGAIYDPFEYLALRHKHGKLNTTFSKSLGRIAYHVACHQRVQNIGLKTRDILSLVPETTVEAIERCSGHDGTYAVKREYHEVSMKIARPVVNKVKQAQVDHYTSDCPMAAEQIANGLDDGSSPDHPMTLLKMAYGL
ncbi:MAG: heterodisulfide reductase-related iron-sulfur binding cluster, partial [Gammaproteobacteria bacterium]|nr:heterodisulfide reductase-related iron-sulfur binding cluster [Gammaproteobacteria bacterium]